MSQSRIFSMIEVVCNVASGFVIAWLIWVFLMPPLFGISTNASQGFWVTVLFTTVSIIRGYIWRRLFNNREKSELR
jgi:membrane protein implicated in regulation of membrane protease activity